MNVRVTVQVARVLRELLNSPQFGMELMRLTGLPSGTIYPILKRLETAAWIDSQTEDIDPVEEGRPQRKFYALTEAGERQARHALAGLRSLTDPPD